MAAQNLAWGTPILSRLVWGQSKFSPGAFHTGRFSIPVAWSAIVFLVFGIVLCMFPSVGPDPEPEAMNYTVVINVAVWGGCTAYYFLSARKWFTGPRTTLEELEGIAGGLTEEQREELAGEGIVSKSETRRSCSLKSRQNEVDRYCRLVVGERIHLMMVHPLTRRQLHQRSHKFVAIVSPPCPARNPSIPVKNPIIFFLFRP